MTEAQAAKARRLDGPTVVVVLLVIPALVLHFSEPQGTLRTVSTALNWAIYGWFLFEFLYMLRLAPDNRAYFRHNKLDLTWCSARARARSACRPCPRRGA